MSTFRNLTSTTQLERAWIESELLPLCDEMRGRDASEPTLAGRALYCLFYEPSFLTRTSFERAMGLLGGTAYHTEDASQFFPVKTPNFVDNTISILASLHIDLVVLRSSESGVIDRAAESGAVPIINGGSLDDHPTQALADICTLTRELGAVDGISIAVVGRLEHRNVSALLRGLALYDDVRITLIPISGQADPAVVSYCQDRGMKLVTASSIDAVREVDAIYLNGPRTVAHVQLLRARESFNIRIDADFMSMLRPHCVILDPMQRSGDFAVEVQDRRLAFYRQAENALYVRMALLSQMLRR
jgi:aspartate carbamoyltransferase catalytic subunit